MTFMHNDDIFIASNDNLSIYSTAENNKGHDFRDILLTNYRLESSKNPNSLEMGIRLRTSSKFKKMNDTSKTETNILRPMTAVKGAGYTSTLHQEFDPLNLKNTVRNFLPETEKEETPAKKIKQVEWIIMNLIEESIQAGCQSNTKVALEKAREASSRERALIKLQEQAGLSDNHNMDLTFAVIFNLACQYSNSDMYTEAIVTYQAITRNRNFINSTRLKINIGNIFVKTGQLSQAIKMYRMALDQTTTTQKYLRIKIMHNIGMLFVRMGRLEEAANSFELIIKEKPDLNAGMHAILCYFALSREDKMKKGFLELLDISVYIDHDNRYNINTHDIATNILSDTVKYDNLSKLENDLKINAEKTILNAANLIAPVIDETVGGGFAWCIDAIKSSVYRSLAANLEITRAMVFLYNRELRIAIESLKVFENQDTKINSSASSVLSFIYFLREEYDLAEKYSEAAITADNNNIAAYVNISACSILKNKLQNAKKYLLLALENNANHVQGLYNLGLVYKKKNMFEESLECFWKLKKIVRCDPLIIYQIGHIYQLNNNIKQAFEWYNQLLSIISDPGVLKKLGEMFDSIGEKQQAYQYYSDVYRFYPASFDTINWLGSYFVTMQIPEKALIYYKKAVELDPDQPKWRLLVASCLRQVGQFNKAFTEYQDIHKKFPDNTECLKFLVKLCQDLGLKEIQTYVTELRKIERKINNKDKYTSRKLRTNSGQSNCGTLSRNRSGLSTFSECRIVPALNNKYFLKNENINNFNHKILINCTETKDSFLHDKNYKFNEKKYNFIGDLSVQSMNVPKKKDNDFGNEQLGMDLLPE